MPTTTPMPTRAAAPSAASTRHRADEMLAALYADHGSALRRFTKRLTGDPGSADDIVQETMMRAWRHPDRVGDRTGAPRAWLYTVARRLAIDQHRARQARPAEAADLTVLADRAAPDHIDAAITRWDLASALAGLRPRDRHLLTTYYLWDRSIGDIATELNVPPGTVKSRLSAARDALRRNLQSGNGSPGRGKPTTPPGSGAQSMRTFVTECRPIR